MTVEFREIDINHTNVLLNCMHFGTIRKRSCGVYFNTASVKSIEQILSKMKELQGEDK